MTSWFTNHDDVSEVLIICLKGRSKQKSEFVDNTLIISDWLIHTLWLLLDQHLQTNSLFAQEQQFI